MLSIDLIAIGKLKNDPLLDVFEDYKKRLFWKFSLIELDGKTQAEQLSKIESELKPKAALVVMDERGKSLSSRDFAAKFDAWLQKYGSDRIILGADVKNNYISINGWKEECQQTLFDFLNTYINKGVSHVLCTDISKDGMLQGPAIELYKQIMERFPACHLIASGGVSSLNDILNLDKVGIPAVVFGKAIYEGKLSLQDLAEHYKLNAL